MGIYTILHHLKNLTFGIDQTISKIYPCGNHSWSLDPPMGWMAKYADDSTLKLTFFLMFNQNDFWSAHIMELLVGAAWSWNEFLLYSVVWRLGNPIPGSRSHWTTLMISPMVVGFTPNCERNLHVLLTMVVGHFFQSLRLGMKKGELDMKLNRYKASKNGSRTWPRKEQSHRKCSRIQISFSVEFF